MDSFSPFASVFDGISNGSRLVQSGLLGSGWRNDIGVTLMETIRPPFAPNGPPQSSVDPSW